MSKKKTNKNETVATQTMRVRPGIYRVCILMTYVEWVKDTPALCWALDILGPLGTCGGLLKRSRLDHSEDGVALRREFAVLGINLVSWRGLDLARQQLHNVQAFVEVLPSAIEGEDRVHILQRATTHELAPPDDWTLTEDERRVRLAEVDFRFDNTQLSAQLSAMD